MIYATVSIKSMIVLCRLTNIMLIIIASIVIWVGGCVEEQNEIVLIDEIITPKDDAPMRLVPAGDFLMGTSDAEMELYRILFPLRAEGRFVNERPQHLVYLDAFYIDKFEVTNKLYQKFIAETGYPAKSYLNRAPYNLPELPAVVLNWEDAAAYARWAGKRLPTEAEWEKAARGTDARIWPWGDEWDASKLNANDGTGAIDGYAQTAPVGQYPQGISPYGVHDMAGNIWEWVADWYDPHYYQISPRRNPTGPPTGEYHVLRGGGWAENYDFARCASRWGSNPGSLLRGFRCAKDTY
ncbi:TPA: formylglycine-generating enzyme family protein [Candidatus Poribacteria bacterium]|nr:formylglycine-generating enzyme family protein [Candidatus Poribacteria bacterium]